jgi:DNA-binding NarL/FixJ family response regulator
MVLVCATDELAHRIAVAAREPVTFAASVERAMERGAELGARVLLLDVKMGGNRTRAVEAVPRILATVPGVAVVMVSRGPSPQEVAEADALGAYAVIDGKARDFDERVRLVIAVATLMRPARPVLLPRLQLLRSRRRE